MAGQDDLNEELTFSCGVCLTVYEDPRTMACSHTLCEVPTPDPHPGLGPFFQLPLMGINYLSHLVCVFIIIRGFPLLDCSIIGLILLRSA